MNRAKLRLNQNVLSILFNHHQNMKGAKCYRELVTEQRRIFKSPEQGEKSGLETNSWLPVLYILTSKLEWKGKVTRNIVFPSLKKV